MAICDQLGALRILAELGLTGLHRRRNGKFTGQLEDIAGILPTACGEVSKPKKSIDIFASSDFVDLPVAHERMQKSRIPRAATSAWQLPGIR